MGRPDITVTWRGAEEVAKDATFVQAPHFANCLYRIEDNRLQTAIIHDNEAQIIHVPVNEFMLTSDFMKLYGTGKLPLFLLRDLDLVVNPVRPSGEASFTVETIQHQELLDDRMFIPDPVIRNSMVKIEPTGTTWAVVLMDRVLKFTMSAKFLVPKLVQRISLKPAVLLVFLFAFYSFLAYMNVDMPIDDFPFDDVLS